VNLLVMSGPPNQVAGPPKATLIAVFDGEVSRVWGAFVEGQVGVAECCRCGGTG
jgi:hypothetical protein